MAIPKQGTATNGQIQHYSVGAVIQQEERYLLIDRMKPPLGYAGIAGHIDAGEDTLKALAREVREESGLRVITAGLVLQEEVHNNTCSKGISVHQWFVYRCTVAGELIHNPRETKSIGWYTVQELGQLPLEPVWRHWFTTLKILKQTP